MTAVQSRLSVRTYELATLAAARALRSSYCSLAHGSVLADKVFDAAAVNGDHDGSDQAPLEPAERAMMAFVEKVVVNAERITTADIDVLRSHGYGDEAILIWPQRPLPGVSSASSSMRWACRPTRFSMTSTRRCARR